MIKFNELGQLPFQLERMDEGCGIEMVLVANSAHYHQLCRLKCNNTMYVRAEKRSRVLEADSDDVPVFPACKHSRRSRSMEDGVQKMFALSVESHQAIVVFMKQLHSKIDK